MRARGRDAGKLARLSAIDPCLEKLPPLCLVGAGSQGWPIVLLRN